MDKAWVDVIKITGAVGVVAFLAYIVINYVYSDKVIELFGSDRMFILSIGIVSSVFIILLIAVLKQKDKAGGTGEQGKVNENIKIIETEGPKVTYQDKAKHNGNNNF